MAAPLETNGPLLQRADASGLAAIEARMQKLCLGRGDHPSQLGRMAWEHISARGKRLRARLALSAVHALGGDAADGVAWGASCEFRHKPQAIKEVLARFASGGALHAVWERIEDIRGALENSASLRREPALAALVHAFIAAALRPVAPTRPTGSG